MLSSNPHPLPRDLQSLSRSQQILGPRQLLVLSHILALRARREPVTVRRLSALAGIRTKNGVLFHLKGLRRKGLIEWEPTHGNTIRPLVRFVPAEALDTDDVPG